MHTMVMLIERILPRCCEPNVRNINSTNVITYTPTVRLNMPGFSLS